MRRIYEKLFRIMIDYFTLPLARGLVRVVRVSGCLWYSMNDVYKTLNLSYSPQSCRRLASFEKARISYGRKKILFINRSALLVLFSKRTQFMERSEVAKLISKLPDRPECEGALMNHPTVAMNEAGNNF